MKTERISLFIGIVISGLLTCLALSYFSYKETPTIQRAYSPFLETLEVLDFRFNDLKYKFKSAKTSEAPVAMIAIDDDAVREIGRWPWSREQMAEMTDRLVALGAQSVGFDAIFSEPEKANPGADLKFGQVVEKNPDKVILGVFSDNKFDFKPYQDLCVAEAFLKTGGDQIVKLNPSFALDESTNVIDDLNWNPLFETLFVNIQNKEQNDVLQHLGKNSAEELTPYQQNYMNSRKSQALFEYCARWLTSTDDFLAPEIVTNVTPLYLDIVKKTPELKDLNFEQLSAKIKSSFKPHPIPQYGEWTPNIPEIQKPAAFTASFIAELDADGYVRRYPLFFRSGNKLGSSFIPSLALQSYLLSGPYRAEVKMKSSSNGTKSIDEFNIYDTSTDPEKKVVTYPVDKSGQMLINYYGRQMSFPYVSAKELFNDRPTVRVRRNVVNAKTKQIQITEKEYNKSEFFKGRSVLVGATAVGLYDLRNTPVEANYPGPELHLTMLANLLEMNFLKQWPLESKAMPWIILVVGVLLSIAWAWMGSLSSMVVFVVALIASVSFDLWIFIKDQTLVHSFLFYFTIFSAFFAIQIFKYFTEEKKKRELKSTFSKYVSPAVVDELLKDAANLKLGGRRERMTAFFSDVRGFTTISEKLSPEELSRVLNLYLTPMTDIVFKNSGTLDKYMGDAIMAFFGAPVKDKNHAEHACRCALESLKKLEELQKTFAEKNLPMIDIGIGINTGDMSVGNMGSNIVQNYTIMGDSVNLASRLEGINKEYGTRIVISEFTYAEVKNSFTAREIDRVRVKGKLEPVRIYELVCEGKAKGELAEKLHLFDQGFELYQSKKFSEALEIFNKTKTMSQNDPVSELYVERCQDYIESPPPLDWDGVYVMKTK
ncbi:CHASE2 domain-containing protein [Bdellovibrio sp. HCB-110]|uniref:CHASE2 domain-containing protein n=1 Tax=Bdellovibrio sp. HCB-110 TaxID=3391182 RepID=UPI0039B5BBB6